MSKKGFNDSRLVLYATSKQVDQGDLCQKSERSVEISNWFCKKMMDFEQHANEVTKRIYLGDYEASQCKDHMIQR
jgi:hypothetical protein